MITAAHAPLSTAKQPTQDPAFHAMIRKFWQRVGDPKYNDMRRGQLFFHTLAEHDETLADSLLLTPLDPFYNDSKLEAAIDWTMYNWDSMR